MEPITSSALVSGGLSLAGAALGSAGNKRAAKVMAKQSAQNLQTQIDYNKWAMNYEYEKNLEHWNRTNEYNSPAAQVQRLIDAGLSPALAYQSLGGNTASAGNVDMNVPPVDTSKVKSEGAGYGAKAFASALANFLPSLISMQRDIAGIENVQADTESKQAGTDLARSSADLNRVEAFMRQLNGLMKFTSDRFDYNLKKELRDNSLEMASYNLQRLKQDMDVNFGLGALRKAEIGVKQGQIWRFGKEKELYGRYGILPGDNSFISNIKYLGQGLVDWVLDMISVGKKSGLTNYN